MTMLRRSGLIRCVYPPFVAALILLSGRAEAAGPSIIGFAGFRNDSLDTFKVVGWACSPGSPSPVSVTVYARDPQSREIAITSGEADAPSGAASAPAVAKACGDDGPHAFSLRLGADDLGRLAGRTFFVTAQYQGMKRVLSSPGFNSRADAGSQQSIAGIDGFNLLIDCSENRALNCATGLNVNMTGVGGAPAYAYAASIVHIGPKFHMFFCSVGGDNHGWDSIRYASSGDGVRWSVPVVKVTPTSRAEDDLSSCDPSVVYFRGYYYLFYGSAYKSSHGNRGVIRVARSPTIDGVYRVLARSGKWGASEKDPPAKLIEPARDVQTYGAGQPTVLVLNNRILMWYTDTSYDYPRGNIMFVQSDDGIDWSKPLVTDAHTVNVDVKWDPKQKTFIMFSVGPVDGSMVVRTRSSKDGVIWGEARILSALPNNPFHFCAQNIGVSSDREGVMDVQTLVTYMAPFVNQLTTSAGKDLTCKSTFPQWNLYGALLTSPVRN